MHLLYWSQGDRSAAIDALERALADYRATFGPRHPYTVSVDNRLGSWREQHTWRWRRRTHGPAGRRVRAATSSDEAA
ncbi:tetratricopeptide repeat protein [Streptomyces sp. NPDC093252]|uniref:tetratricopeptide repeat protein n=1 Tax=Streptomyces sp. NPDC093252 TaxID=3154980 RepID=UPI003437308D